MWQIIFHCMDVPHLFTHSLADGHLGPFHVGAIMNNAAVNIHVQVFLWRCFTFSWVYTWSGIAKLC